MALANGQNEVLGNLSTLGGGSGAEVFTEPKAEHF